MPTISTHSASSSGSGSRERTSSTFWIASVVMEIGMYGRIGAPRHCVPLVIFTAENRRGTVAAHTTTGGTCEEMRCDAHARVRRVADLGNDGVGRHMERVAGAFDPAGDPP